ncbi:MAG TPA: hypothetical protein VLL97_02645 [Acidobacteriota bacterium]|nr:hypothetical protein [Acidobacteriota bacterium]
MISESHFLQYIRRYLIYIIPVCILFIAPSLTLGAQAQKTSLPDPVQFNNTQSQVANMIRSVFNDMEFSIELDDRTAGRITTRPYEFISGALTAGELQKIAALRNTTTGNWLRARYSVEAILDIVSPTTTMVTVHATIEALNRNFEGTEQWIELDSLGTVERRVLGRISVGLMGTDAPAKERKGFWGQDPQPVDPRQPRFPTDTVR